MAPLALVAACSTFGCSLLFTTGPGSEAAPSAAPIAPDCSTSQVPPLVDTLLGGYQVVRTGLAIGADDSSYTKSPISREVDIGLGIGLTSLFVLSAIHGYSATGACDRAQNTWAVRPRRRLERAPPAESQVPPREPPLGPPPDPPSGDPEPAEQIDPP